MTQLENRIPYGSRGAVRRHLLKAIPTMGVLGLASRGMAATLMPKQRNVAVVGAGIIGATLAYELAGMGAKVTLIDPAPGQGCTQGAFAMLIAGHASGPPIFNDLYMRAVADWRRFELEFGGEMRVQWGGTLNWAAPGERSTEMERAHQELVSMGVAATTLAPADIARLTPGARAGEFGYGYFLPEQGAVDVDHAMSLVLEGCGSRQVEFTTSPVEELVILDGVCRGVQTGNRLIPADTVVLAAGAHNTHLAKMAGGKVPLDIVSGTLAHSEPMPPILNRVLNGPLGSIKQNPDGRIVTGLDYAPGADGTDTSAEYGRQLLANAAQVVPQLGSARLERMTVGHVPIPENDMMPIVGHLRTTPNVYVSSMMSGVTMAPLMGRLAAFEIVSGTRLGVLSPFRPERFENT